MSVGDVVNLIGQVDGFNQRMLDDYGQRLMDNNINGTVLLSCDLAELKPVLQMAFGDWVLFRSLVEYLRYSEQNREPSDGEVTPPTEPFLRSAAVCNMATVGTAKNISATAATVDVTNSVTSSSKKATSDMTLTSVSNTDAVLAEPSRSSPTLKEVPTPADIDVTDDVKKTGSVSPKRHPLSRQDSFVNEVLMESETLRDFIQASVLGSDSDGGNADTDDEVQRPITTIPEETSVVSRNTSASSLSRLSMHRQMSVATARRMSTESGPIDRAFSVGPDHDSGESDSEVEQVSRKSSIRIKPEKDAPPGSSASEERRKKSTSKSMRHNHDSYRAPKLPDKSKSASKLDKGGSECSVPLMSLYFPIACDRSHAGSQSSGFVSPKPSGPPVSQASGPSSRHSESSPPVNETEFSHSSTVASTALPSSQHETSSSSSGPYPQPTSSTATTSANHVTPSQQLSESGESAEAAASDDVKFFIVDESDTSPKAIMVEMESLPPHRVTSSVTSSSQRDTDVQRV